MTRDKDKTLQTRVTQDEYDIIKTKAKGLGLDASNYMRLCCLYANITIKVSIPSEEIEHKSDEKDEQLRVLQMRLTDAEYNSIENRATQLGLNTTNYMRMVCLHANVDVTIPSPSKGLHTGNNKRKSTK